MSGIIKDVQTRCWITKVLESGLLPSLKNRLLRSIIIFGLIPDVNIIRFFIVKQGNITKEFFVGYFFAFVLFNIGPYLVWHYDEKLLPGFFVNVEGLVSDKKKLKELYKKYSYLFSKKSWMIIIPVFIFLFPMWIYGLPIAKKGGFLGLDDPDYWISLLYTIWLLFFTCYFAGAALVTIFTIREISLQKLRIDPLHPDKLGGLSCVGDLAIGTTLMLSVISFIIPLGFVIGTYVQIAPYVYISVFAFIIFLLFSFLYPTFKIHDEAKVNRDEILNKLRNDYNKLSQLNDHYSLNDIEILKNYLRIDRIRSQYFDYKTLSLYPFETEIFVKLMSSVILPVIFLLIERFKIL